MTDEGLKPEHLDDEYTSQQIIERMAWAVLDAQEATRLGSSRRRSH